MTKRKSFRAFIAIVLSLVMLVGVLPAAALAEGEREIESMGVWVDNRTTPYPWAPPHAVLEGEPIYVMVQVSYSDGKTEFLSAEELNFTVADDVFTFEAVDTGTVNGQILIRPEQPLLVHFFNLEVSLKEDPTISAGCNIQIDELVVQMIVKGQEDGIPVVKKGQSLQLSYEVYPEGAESKLDWSDWQQDFPEGKIGTDSNISKDGLLYIGWNETETAFIIFPPISQGPQTARYSACAPTIMIETGTLPHTHTSDDGVITKAANCTEAGVITFTCTECKGILRTESIAKLGHNWNDGVITTPATQEKEGEKTFTCKRCNANCTESIPKLPVSPGNKDAKFLQARADEILRDGLSKSDLRLDGKTLTLVLDGREFVLSTNAKNRNVSGEISLGDGYYLKFDIKGNGSNVKEFKVFQK